MAEASKTMKMSVPREVLWKTITNYESYPEFVDGARNVKVLSREPGRTRVQYSIELLGKDIHYTLDHIEDHPEETMRWEMVDSNLLKANSGTWILKDLGGGKTEATYTLELEFKIPVPKLVVSGLVRSSLPRMLSQFESRAKEATASPHK